MAPRLFAFFNFMLMIALWDSPAAAQCLLCKEEVQTTSKVASAIDERPLSIEIAADLDFSRLTTNGSDGQILVDAAAQGRQLQGDVVDLGGYALRGEVVITGTPGRAVRINLPTEIELTSVTGGRARVSPVTTNLPPMPRLDASGRLVFHFGGKLHVGPGMDGNFRGRIPITADYE